MMVIISSIDCVANSLNDFLFQGNTIMQVMDVLCVSVEASLTHGPLHGQYE